MQQGTSHSTLPATATPPGAVTSTERSMSNASSTSPLKHIPGAVNYPHQSPVANAQHPTSSCPSFHSPDASSIFERDVQESSIPSEVAPAIPAHIKTEDMIPPALEASSLAITDNHLRPDEVEIVTHPGHQPAGATISETVSGPASESFLPLSPSDLHDERTPATLQHHESEDSAPNYGALDPSDVRRLSFISFADVVQAEHAESGSNQSLHHLPLAGSHQRPQSRGPNSSPSPARSPVSSTHGINNQPHMGIGSDLTQGAEVSPVRSPIGSPSLGAPQQHGELAIETMSQALRRPRSEDLGHVSRTMPTSATSPTVGQDETLGKSTFR